MKKEKFDITCIGYKSAFDGSKMHYYKLNRNNKEYLLINAGMIRLLHMIWNSQNEFVNSDLWDDFERPCPPIEKEIENAVKASNKKKYELKEDEEKSFFTQHEVVKPKIKKIVRKKGVLSSEEVNSLMRIIKENSSFGSDVKFVLTKKMIESVEEEFFELEGYKVNYETDGKHKNDGQMVEYIFTLESPKGKKTRIITEMCLMVGWNFHQECKIS